MKKLRIIVYLILNFTLNACFEKNGEIYQNIALADSLSRYDQRDSAKKILQTINLSSATEREKAYLNLISFRFSDTDTTKYDSILWSSEKLFYSKYDKNKLSEIYLKISTHYFRDRDMYDSAIYYLPKSEKLALEVNDYYLLTHINYLKSIFHYYERDLNNAKLDNDLQFLYANKSHSQRLIAYAKLDKAMVCKELNMKDSAKFWLNATLLDADKIEFHDKALIYNAFGELSEEKDTALAIEDFQKSLEFYSYIPAQINLAKVYLKKKNFSKVEEICNEGLQYEWPETRIEFLKLLCQCRKLQNNYVSAIEIQEKIISAKDSIIKIINTENQKLASTQFRFYKNNNTQNGTYFYKNILILVGIIIVLIIIIIYHKNKCNLLKKELLSLNQQFEAGKKINSKIINVGEIFYTQITNNQPIASWTTVDMVNFIEYYRAIKPDFVEDLDNNYNKLSPRYKIILILEDMQKSIDEIKIIMSFEETSYYSAKSRINGAKK